MDSTYKKVKKVLWLILGANLLVAAIKIITGAIIKSTSMVADGFHSITDSTSNIVGIVGIKLASRPKDDNHPYGHKKIEMLAGLFVAIMLVLLSYKTITDAVARISNPIMPKVSLESLLLLVFTVLLNILVSTYEYKKGKELDSMILISDSMHTRSDVYVSLGVLVTLILIKLGLPPIIDPIASFIVAAFIIHAAYEILKDNIGILLDKAVVDVDKIKEIALSFEQIKDVHDIRSRGTKNDLYIDMHIKIKADMDIESSHDLIHKLEDRLRKDISESVQLITHIEPYHNDKQGGLKMTGNERTHSQKETKGPKAPKDPVKKRSAFYIMLDTKIEATKRNVGRPSQEIYLVGEQHKTKARLVGGITDESILKYLESCQGFRTLVHSIGVSLKSTEDPEGTACFILQNWGKEDIYNTGTKIELECPKDGREIILKLDDYDFSPYDDVPGKYAFELDRPGEVAEATIRYYLNDGFEVKEASKEEPVNFKSPAYKEMIAKSLLSKGNNYRLKKAIEKAKRGEDVTIAYIGGSITQGASAKPINKECYAYKSYNIFKDMFASGQKDNIHFIKAGVGGTPSQLGMIRYERDILRYGRVEPDIVIVEFAVNDEGDETKGISYESLCLKILAAENKPALILLFSVFVNDWNLQDRLAPVGYHYDLPMVSVKDAVVDQFKLTKDMGNVITKRQFFYDIYHPTNEGHTIMADCLAYLFKVTDEADISKEDIIINKSPIIGNDFRGIKLLDRRDTTHLAQIDEGSFTGTDTDLQKVEMDTDVTGTAQFPYNWMHIPGTGNKSFTIKIKSKSLILVYKDSDKSNFGKADIIIDGQYVRTEDPHINNWTHCNAVILYKDTECKEHTVEIKMAEADQDKFFTILGFGYTF
ncbi:MAG: cation diffusion facilitator family transporter [Caldicoprobacterales bacterium]